MAEIPLPFGRLFGENMAQVLFFVFNLACSGKRIALGGAFFGFHLWHDAAPLFIRISKNEGRTLFFGFGA
jgi:hypothetical protein